LSELIRPILSKETNGRDVHTKLVRYIVKTTVVCRVNRPLSANQANSAFQPFGVDK